jgi:hypothetical protein
MWTAKTKVDFHYYFDDTTVLGEFDNDTGTHDDQFDVDYVGDSHYDFDDAVLADELDNDTGTHDPQFDLDDFGEFHNFDLDESDGDTNTHPGTSTVIQATSQLEDDTLLAPAQPDSTQKRKRGWPKGSKDKQPCKKRQKHTEANVAQAGGSAGAV